MNTSTKTDKNRRVAVLGVLASALVEELRVLSRTIPSFSDDPVKHAMSPKFAIMQNAAFFCGYWSVGNYIGAAGDLALRIETEPQEVSGRDEFISRVQTLQNAIKAMGLYLTDVARGVNANNSSLNECFRNMVRKCSPEVLTFSPQQIDQMFFMAVPLTLEIDALWVPEPGASREALLVELAKAQQGNADFTALARVNPYPSLSGMFEGLLSQWEMAADPEISAQIVSFSAEMLDLLSNPNHITPPAPHPFLLSRLLWSAAHNLSGDPANERFRKRYALLNPAVMKAEDGIVSMHGLAKAFSKSLQDICDIYIQASVVRQTNQIEQMARILSKESQRLGLDAFDQLTITFNRAVEDILEIERVDAQRRELETNPEIKQSAIPAPDVFNAWIRGAEVLTLIKQTVETWHSEQSQEDMLQIASRANFDGVLGTSTTMQEQSRDAAVGHVMSSLQKELSTLKASIENAMKMAEGQTLDEAKAARAAEVVGRPSQALFGQASGVMDVLGLQQGALYAQQILGEIIRPDTWRMNESRLALFEHIARYSVFIGRLRPGALQDLEPEEVGLESFAGATSSEDLPSMAIFSMVTEEIELGQEFADHASSDLVEVEAQASSSSTDDVPADLSVLEAAVDALEVALGSTGPYEPVADLVSPATEVIDTELAQMAVSADIETENLERAPVERAEDKAGRMLDFFLSAGTDDTGATPAAEDSVQPPEVIEQTSPSPAAADGVLVHADDLPSEISQDDLSQAPHLDVSSGQPGVDIANQANSPELVAMPGDAAHAAAAVEIVVPAADAQDDLAPAALDAEDESGSDELILADDEITDSAQSDTVAGESLESFASLMAASRRGVDELTLGFEAAQVDAQDDLRSIDDELATVMAEESTRCIDSLSQALQSFAGADEEERHDLLGSIKRDIHTLKGVCRTCGLMRAGNVFHVMEDELELLGDDAEHFLSTITAYEGAIRAAQDLLESFLSGIAREVVPMAAAGEQAPQDIAEDPVATALKLPAMVIDTDTQDALDLQAAQADVAEQAALAPLALDAAVMPALGSSGTTPAAREVAKPKADTSVRLPIGVVVQVGVATGGVLAAERRLSESLERARRVAKGLEANIKRMSVSIREIEIMAAARIAASTVASSAAADFDPLELDRYTALQEVVRSLTETHRDVLADIEALTAELSEVDRDEADLHEVSDELQRESSGMMLMPLAVQSVRLGSVVQRAATDAGKQVDLVIERDCRIPSAAVDKLMPVFEHLLRNGVAHGIESDRAAAGKSAVGRLTIGMSRQVAEIAGMVTITVRDDGAGVNVQRVLELARQRGLAKAGRDYTDADIHEFIFMPGFSTAAEVTQLSGRGVGLDVVRDAVSRIGGVIAMESRPGQGTEFIISLPTDAATMAVLPVQQGKNELLMPVSIIREVVPLGVMTSQRLRLVNGFYELDGRQLEITSLASKLPGRSAGDALASDAAKLDAGYLVIMREGTGSKAVHVQGVKSQFRASVSPLGPYIRAIPGFVAGTVGQGGRVSLIVNPLRMTDIKDEAQSGHASQKRQACLMVVDDSPSMRLVNERAVRRLGFSSVASSDGLDALRRLAAGAKVDGFLVDLEMPGMDGFSLIAELRRMPEHAKTPIVVISSRSAQKHQEKAALLGANDYLAKPYDDAVFERTLAKHFAREIALT